ncbi:hypothetical protein HDU96_009100 [Phlyctochytrium bullatum]|nr:hypothetical protein HDU96_009100 [Phlyctochytrium bullatum]
MGLDRSTPTGDIGRVFGKLVTEFQGDTLLGFTYNPPEVRQAQQYCPSFNNGVCLNEGDQDENDGDGEKKLQRGKGADALLHKLKCHLLEYNIRTAAKHGIRFTRIVAFGSKAADVLRDLPDDLNLPMITAVFHPSYLLHHDSLGLLFKSEQEPASAIEAIIVTSATRAICEAIIPKFCQRIVQDGATGEEVWLPSTRFFGHFIRTEWEKADLQISHIKRWISADSDDDSDRKLNIPLRDKRAHDLLNKTPLATKVLRPYTDVAPLVSKDWIEVCRQKESKRSAAINTPLKLLWDNREIDLQKVFIVKEAVEGLVDIL